MEGAHKDSVPRQQVADWPVALRHTHQQIDVAQCCVGSPQCHLPGSLRAAFQGDMSGGTDGGGSGSGDTTHARSAAHSGAHARVRRRMHDEVMVGASTVPRAVSRSICADFYATKLATATDLVAVEVAQEETPAAPNITANIAKPLTSAAPYNSANTTREFGSDHRTPTMLTSGQQAIFFAVIMALLRLCWRAGELKCQTECGKCLCSCQMFALYQLKLCFCPHKIKARPTYGAAAYILKPNDNGLKELLEDLDDEAGEDVDDPEAAGRDKTERLEQKSPEPMPRSCSPRGSPRSSPRNNNGMGKNRSSPRGSPRSGSPQCSPRPRESTRPMRDFRVSELRKWLNNTIDPTDGGDGGGGGDGVVGDGGDGDGGDLDASTTVLTVAAPAGEWENGIKRPAAAAVGGGAVLGTASSDVDDAVLFDRDYVRVSFPARLDNRFKNVFACVAVGPTLLACAAAIVYMFTWPLDSGLSTLPISLYAYHDYLFKSVSGPNKQGPREVHRYFSLPASMLLSRTAPWLPGDRYFESTVSFPFFPLVVAAVVMDLTALAALARSIGFRRSRVPDIWLKFCIRNIGPAAHKNTDSLVIESTPVLGPQPPRITASDDEFSHSTVNMTLSQIGRIDDVPWLQSVAMAACIVVGGLPFASLAIISYDVTHAEDIGIALGVFACLRALFGPFFLIKAGLVLNATLALKCSANGTFAKQCCGPRCVRLGSACCLVGVALSLTSLFLLFFLDPDLVLTVLKDHHPVSYETVLLSAAVLTGGCTVYGIVLGFMRGLPVDPEFFMTSFSRGLFLQYTPLPRCCFDQFCCCHRGRMFCDGLWVQSSLVYINVEDGLDLKALLRADLPGKLSADEVAYRTKVAELEAMFTAKELASLKRAFEETDLDGSGAISVEELDILLNVAMKGKITKDQVAELMNSVSDDKEAELEWDGFLELMLDAGSSGGSILGEVMSKALNLEGVGGDGTGSGGKRLSFMGTGDDFLDNVMTISLPAIPGAETIDEFEIDGSSGLRCEGSEWNDDGPRGDTSMVLDLTTFVGEDMKAPFKCARPWCGMVTIPNFDPDDDDDIATGYHTAVNNSCSFHPGNKSVVTVSY